MRHRVAGRKLSRHTKHRELMFRNMLLSLLQHERIRTTLAKGKELRGWVDRIITLGKKGTLHARRQAFDLLRSHKMVKKLFDEVAPKLKGREGGYTRIYKMGWRQGDGAPLSLVELVTFSHPEEKKSPVKKAKEVLEKVTPKKKGKEEGEEKKEEKRGKKEKKEEIGKKEEKKEKRVKEGRGTPKEKQKKTSKEKSK